MWRFKNNNYLLVGKKMPLYSPRQSYLQKRDFYRLLNTLIFLYFISYCLKLLFINILVAQKQTIKTNHQNKPSKVIVSFIIT